MPGLLFSYSLTRRGLPGCCLFRLSEGRLSVKLPGIQRFRVFRQFVFRNII
jgi:hypothetical protein